MGVTAKGLPIYRFNKERPILQEDTQTHSSTATSLWYATRQKSNLSTDIWW